MMKKTIVFISLFFITSFSVAQQEAEEPKTNEIKLNVFNLAVYTAIDLSYEYLQHENHSFGINVFFNIKGVDGDNSIFEHEVENRNFSVAPYYRRYFSKKYAKGLFLEGFGMVSSGKYLNTIDNGMSTKTILKNYTTFSSGLTVGIKLVSKKGFAIDFYYGGAIIQDKGLGRDISRGGISIGYRF